MLTAAQKTRIGLIITGFLVIVAMLWARLLWLQVLHPNHWVSIARRQHLQVLELSPVRGAILDRNLKPLAVSLRLSSVFADPRHMKNPAKAAKKLSPLLNIPEKKLLAELSRKERGFVWLARRIPNQTARSIRALKLQAVHLVMEPQRFYPHGYLASHVIGFAGLDAQGLEGLEMTYDRLLKGQQGWRWLSRDARRRPVGAWDAAAVKPRDGMEIILTLDTSIQFMAEKAVDQVFQKYRAKGASVVVMDPYSGQILGLANRPTYDPNRFWKSSQEDRRNRAVTDTFEPGSVFKVVIAATALGTGAISLTDRFDCENGAYKVAGRLLHDHTPHGVMTFRDVITYSSNIGVAKAAMRLGAQTVYKGIKAFGIGERTGIDLPGEGLGVIRHPKQWSKPTITTVPMGHEVSVNAVQLAQMISVIANGGYLVKPWVVKEVRDRLGNVVHTFGPKVIRKVITPPVAEQLKQVLTGVVTEGTGKQAHVIGWQAAGKTGTAQKLEPNGQYSHSKFVASFIGFVPADRPALSIVVVVDEPRFPYYGGVVAAPAFSEIASQALGYLRVPARVEPVQLQPARLLMAKKEAQTVAGD